MRGYWLILFVVLFVQGCAQSPSVVPNATPGPVAVSTHVPSRKAPAIQVEILVSEDTPAYTEVANELVKMLGTRGSIHILTASKLNNLRLIKKLNNNEHIQFVSIGLNAAIASKQLKNRQLVFCQVFNYQDYALLTSKHKGVSMLPSLAQTFNTWRSLSPHTTDIGVISGPGMDDVIAVAKDSAKHYGITLHHETVKSDKEFQYAFKKISSKVQGYWLLPDNRVLSGNALRNIMNFSVRNSKQVAVFSEELLKLGGLLSINSAPHDIAQQVFERLEQAQSKDNFPGPDIVYPEKMNLHINSVMASNLGLQIPAQYRKYSHAP
jgi:ABC-type uncharacterized transport system substrate-binding protein